MISLSDIFRSREFHLPFLISAFIITALVLHMPILHGGAILMGIAQLLFESYARIRAGKWNLDYLAFITLGAALVLGMFLAGAIIALMVTVSAALEKYGTAHAEKTLKGLFENIPKTALLMTDAGTEEVPLPAVRRGDVLLVRPNEMLAFDGHLLSERALLNGPI